MSLLLCWSSRVSKRTCASLGVLTPERQQITTVAAPVGGQVGKALEAMGDAVIDLLLVGVGLVVRLADTFGDDLGIALAVAGIFAVGTLHARGILQEVAAQGTAHDVVELLRDELVTLLLVDLFLLLAHGTLAVETNVERTAVLELFG